MAESWGTPPATGDHVEGAAIRILSDRALLLRRPEFHIHDERLDARLPASIHSLRPTLVFPSIHRSESNVPCLTVHPLGNTGDTAEVGGRPRVLTPTDPRRMASALRSLAERGAAIGLSATFEATHHGPELQLPAMFVEIGYGTEPGPPPSAVRVLADVIPNLDDASSDRVALAVGGGHYAPHFTDLVLKRQWAFGHIISRHSLATLNPEMARSAFAMSEGAEGWLAARAEDAGHPALAGLPPRYRDSDGPSRAVAKTATTSASDT
ncbi:MAG: D-aminoacyl-tRNA deacylase [Thermoplasmata archaeon]|nr:D-aminoacyl-tRNA deacylase [Thermoplasmata archaeon]